MARAGLTSASVALVAAIACAHSPEGPTVPPPGESSPRATLSEPRESIPQPPGDVAPPAGSSRALEPALPSGVEPGVPTVVEVPGDRPLRVIHGEPTTRRALVYFHGICGNVAAIDTWAREVSRYGTLIALLGDQRCGGTRRYKWTQYLPGIDARVDRALRVVSEARGGLLDAHPLTAVGYSQGATRAASLAGRYPEKYTRVLAAGIPVEPRVNRIGRAQVVVVVGGQREETAHMRRGVDALVASGKAARFFSLPGAGHGEYGPEGARVMDEAFHFLFEER